MSFQQPTFGPGSAFASFPSTQPRPPRRTASHASFDNGTGASGMDKDHHHRERDRTPSGPTPVDTLNSSPSHGAWESSDRDRDREHSSSSTGSRSFSSILSPPLNNANGFALGGNGNGNGIGNGDGGIGGSNGGAGGLGAGAGRPFVYSREFLLSLYDEEKASRRPLELADHEVATRDKPTKPWALGPAWREGEKELFANSIHPPSNRNRGGGGAERGAQSTTGIGGGGVGTLDLGSLQHLPRDRDRALLGSSNSGGRGSLDKDGRDVLGSARRSKGLSTSSGGSGGVVGIMGGVLGGIGNQKAPVGGLGERRRQNSSTGSASVGTGTGQVWQGGRWRRAAGENEDELRSSTRQMSNSDPAVNNDEDPSRANDDVPAAWDQDEEDSSPTVGSTSAVKSNLPTPPDSDGLPASSEAAPRPRTPQEPDLTQHATSILGSLSLDEDDSVNMILRQSTNSTGTGSTSLPPGLAPPPTAPPSVDWCYIDSNGQRQGPFAPSQMHEWFRNGYFTLDLCVRRETETEFEELQKVIDRSGDSESPFLTAPFQPVAPPPPAQLPPPAQAVGGGWLGSAAPGGANGASPFYESQSYSANSPLSQQSFGGVFGSTASSAPVPASQAALDPWGAPLPSSQPAANSFSAPSWSSYAGSPFGGQQPQHQQLGPGQFAAPVVDLFRQVAIQEQQHRGLSPSDSMFPSHRPLSGVPGSSPFFDPNQISAQPAQPDWNRLNGLPLQPPQQPLPQPIGHNSWSSLPSSQHLGHQQQQQQFGSPHLPYAPSPVAAAWPSSSAPLPAQPPVPIGQHHFGFPPAEPSTSLPISPPSVPAQAPVEPPAPAEAPVIEASEPDGTAPLPAPKSEKVMSPDVTPAPPPISPVVAQPAVTTPVSPVGSPHTPADAPLPVAPSTPAAKTAPSKSTSAKSTPVPSSAAATPVAPAITSAPPAAQSPAPATPAPWVKDEEIVEKRQLSLREIQEAEERQAEVRKAAERQANAKAQAAASLAASQRAAAAEAESLPTTSTWASMSPSSSAQGKAAVKSAPWLANASKTATTGKTLKEIQEEEERRKKAVAAAASAANASSPIAGRGYAASAKAPAPSTGGTWTTVPVKPPPSISAAPAPRPVIPGAAVPGGSRVVSGSAPIAKPISRATPQPASVAVSRPTTQAAPSFDADTPPPPSPEFLKWCKDALKGLTVNMDEFIQMLLSFPLDASADVLEIISDSVYANSSTLDGRRFANEFNDRRRLDVAARHPHLIMKKAAAVPSKPSSMAEALKQAQQPKTSDWNVKVGNGKKKKGGK